jgi:hypothetical protein
VGTATVTDDVGVEVTDRDVAGRNIMRICKIAAATTLGLALGACANATSGSGDASPSGIPHPTAPQRPVLIVSYEGGFVAPQAIETRLPQFALYGDGTLITLGAQTEIYPQRALPPILMRSVNEAGIQAILHAAIDAGLTESGAMTDMGSVGIADAPTTVFRLDAAGVQRTISVYALDAVRGQRPPGMGRDEYEARRRLQRLVEQLGSLGRLLPEGSASAPRPYDAQGARLFISSYQRDPSLKETPVSWPVTAQPLGSFGDPMNMALGDTRCGIVAGKYWTEVLEPVAVQANQLTPWIDDGIPYAIAFRPLLPDEHTCEG